MGLQPDDLIQCAYSAEHPGGCGTNTHCESCGAAVAILLAQAMGIAEERECLLRVRHEGQAVELALVVRACPIRIGDDPATAVFLRDVSAEKRRSAMERVFSHDVTNAVSALRRTSQLFGLQDGSNGQRSPATLG